MNAGIFLNSTSFLNGTFFENAVIFITEHNEKGAMGFVTNKIFPRQFNELEEFKNCISFPLYDGGPVDREHIFFLHQRPDLISGGVPVDGNIFFGGDFKTAVAHINNKILTAKDIKLFIGYCGWDFKDLENEIAEGSWKITHTQSVFQQLN